MGCAETGKSVGVPRRLLDSADLQTKKRDALIEYALRKKIHSILKLVNSRMPFEVVKELSLSIDFKTRPLRTGGP